MCLATGPLQLESQGHLDAVDITYQQWGTLNPQRDNAVLICHAISGDSNAVSWWERLVGPGKAIDTEQWFVVCSNSLGGCQGTTGPSSTAPDGAPFGSRFPFVTIGDMVEVQNRLRDHLGIERWRMVAGGSMGGMQALEWARRFPENTQKVWMTASSRTHSALQISFNEVARQSIMRDPKWKGGLYVPGDGPANGLSVGRMLGHISYLSESAFEAKFGRRIQNGSPVFGPNMLEKSQFQVESYLNHQGDKFPLRFDANSFIVVSNAIDAYECKALPALQTEFLFTSFTSDILYPSWQSRELLELAIGSGCEAKWVDIDLPYGHDAFLLDDVHQAQSVRQYLAN